MKLILAIFVAYFVFFSPIAAHSNKGLKKVLSIVKNIEENMINVDDIVEALTPIIENQCGCCDVQESNFTDGGIVISENGETIIQEHTYDHNTKEAVVTVPAHNGFENNTFIMIGRNSDHPLAGKMMSVSKDKCILHDKPDDVDSEHLATQRGLKNLVHSKNSIEFRYIYKRNQTNISEDSSDYLQLTEEMKKSCAGLTIVKSDTEVVSKEEHERRRMRRPTFVDDGEKIDDKKVGCDNVTAACVDNENPDGCWYWGANQVDASQLHFLSIDQATEMCVKCCFHYNVTTAIIRCDCLTTGQAMSTAYYQLWFECAPYSHYCVWDHGSTAIQDSCPDYTEGACVHESKCPSCSYGEC